MQLIHISDLHLFQPLGLHNGILYLQNALQRVLSGASFAHLYTFAYHNAQRELPNALRGVLSSEDTIFTVTGDIAALPYDDPTRDIDGKYYPYISSLITAVGADAAIMLLGNHDWPLFGSTHFASTRFQTIHRIGDAPRREYFRGSAATLIFFVIDSTSMILPATGEIPAATLGSLAQWFSDGTNGALSFDDGTIFTAQQYADALKIGLLHHFPISQAAYGGRLSWPAYFSQYLKNRRDLINICRSDIDLFLFGHSHHPLVDESGGLGACPRNSHLTLDEEGQE